MDTPSGNPNGDEKPVAGKRRISKSRRVILKEVKEQEVVAQTAKTEAKGNPFDGDDNPFNDSETQERTSPGVHAPQPASRVTEKTHTKPTLFTINEKSPAEKNKASRFFPSQDEKHRHYNNDKETQKSKEELFKISEAKSKANKRLENTQNQVNEVVGIMAQNVDKIKEREIKLDEAFERSKILMNQSEIFQKTTKRIEKKFWWDNMKAKLMLGLCVFLFLLVIIGAALYFVLG